jgi:hypothetical protein
MSNTLLRICPSELKMPSLITAATRHYLLREIVKEHPTLERVALTDAAAAAFAVTSLSDAAALVRKLDRLVAATAGPYAEL